MSKIKILNRKILSEHIYLLQETEFEYLRSNGSRQVQRRITFDRGNGAACLLYNKESRNIILTEQFRFPIFDSDKRSSSIELCAGLLDEDSPEDCMIREIEEETGYLVNSVEKIMEIYPSPGAVTEKLYLFTAEYISENKISDGGGLESEGEEIQIIEVNFDKAMNWISTGKIMDAKTIILLQWAELNKLL